MLFRVNSRQEGVQKHRGIQFAERMSRSFFQNVPPNEDLHEHQDVGLCFLFGSIELRAAQTKCNDNKLVNEQQTNEDAGSLSYATVPVEHLHVTFDFGLRHGFFNQ